ncbi:MAG: putative holin [Mycobacterium sp.]|uniref:putative holin n=1 Tax=Mycobacterium sp. TaxID=1785 RepID=UPI003CC62326
MIPLPRTWVLASAMLVGAAVGLLSGTAGTVLVREHIRPGLVVAAVVVVPTVTGLVLVLLSRRRLLTALGAFLVALAPGWFGALVTIQAASGG